MLKQALVAVSLLTISLPFYSQEVTVNKPKYGFTVGINRSNIEHNIKNVISQNDRIGLRLGVLAEFQLVKGLYFMPKAELSFNRGRLTPKVEYPPVIFFKFRSLFNSLYFNLRKL